ncbi:CAP domain-containing protein [Dendryphion nanum]|uniref:CAP domain-containing protein n=1 Tax=Dendryphion nanum TaxID=256645 RepID=A0A9P9DL68_9PLEO|nr:CAP domain-containing protein [Dendryphion nanum]
MHIPIYALVPLTSIQILTSPSGAPDINDANFKKAALDTHNSDRAKHGVPGLVWDNTVAQFAQNWANNCEWKHSGGKYGENMHGVWSTGPFDYLKSTRDGIHQGWYGEISKYDYNKPGFSMATGHFTQVVWKSTKRVGCAWNQNVCKDKGKDFHKFVCSYDPPGNYGGKFPDNVPRPVKKAGLEVDEKEEEEEGELVEPVLSQFVIEI